MSGRFCMGWLWPMFICNQMGLGVCVSFVQEGKRFHVNIVQHYVLDILLSKLLVLCQCDLFFHQCSGTNR
jgi:hypothetical protein